ncbi:hypothetical protein GCM10023206_09300 [Acinetobacter puyangensis]|uniref:Uncharacterized protein n=1 Tax=Acinetobacter puyangensis TaxID=1096779 RepID=A0A240EAK4_9GAMM|nr:hypothetical protein SAMN05421731_105313 [Acinetobacter puyangensis]
MLYLSDKVADSQIFGEFYFEVKLKLTELSIYDFDVYGFILKI